jgi:hypothetical protein
MENLSDLEEIGHKQEMMVLKPDELEHPEG